MSISTDEVIRIAKLVKLDVTGEEPKLAAMFSETIDYIKVLDELDTKETTETFQISGTTNIFQQTDADSENTTLTQELALKNAPKKAKNLFETQAVFDR